MVLLQIVQMMCKLEITSDGVQWSSFVVYDPVTIKGTGLREHFFS